VANHIKAVIRSADALNALDVYLPVEYDRAASYNLIDPEVEGSNVVKSTVTAIAIISIAAATAASGQGNNGQGNNGQGNNDQGNNGQGNNGQGNTDTKVIAAAPEMDPASVISALTLLAGGLAVIRGRRGRN
jgi:hypothetical protein